MPKIFLFHGFGGSPTDWEFIESDLRQCGFEVINFTLPGHLDQAIDEKFSFKNPKSWFPGKVGFDGKGVFLGYSLGARIASQLALAYGCESLIMISGGIGLDSASAREERVHADKVWADLLLRDAQDFWEQWYQQAIFSEFSQKWGKEMFGEHKSERLKHDAKRLARALELFSPGKQEYLPPLLQKSLSEKFIGSLLYITGQRDKKYQQYAEIVAKIPFAKTVEIKNAGHVLIKESQQELAQIILDYLGDRYGKKPH